MTEFILALHVLLVLAMQVRLDHEVLIKIINQAAGGPTA